VSKPASGTQVSEVDFPISCGAAAQKQFNQAVWILHSFWYDEARLGLWQQSIDANRASTAAALAYVREELGPDAFDGETVHSMDYLEYAYLQVGQDRAARQVVEELQSFGRAKGPNLPMAYAIAAIPARFALERRNWSEAANLTAPPMPFPWERFPWAEAMISYTRALGMAQTGDIAGAETEIAKLQLLKQKLDQAKDDYWARQVEVQRLGASGILAHARANDQQAVELVRAAAELDATMDKHPATPAGARIAGRLATRTQRPNRGPRGIRAILADRPKPVPQPPRRGAGGEAER
jgi:hypothetical protein